MARIAAAALPQSAWQMQTQHCCKCFAARCCRILQGRPSSAVPLKAYPQNPSVLIKSALDSCDLQVDALPLQQLSTAGGFASFCGKKKMK